MGDSSSRRNSVDGSTRRNSVPGRRNSIPGGPRRNGFEDGSVAVGLEDISRLIFDHTQEALKTMRRDLGEAIEGQKRAERAIANLAAGQMPQMPSIILPEHSAALSTHILHNQVLRQDYILHNQGLEKSASTPSRLLTRVD